MRYDIEGFITFDTEDASLLNVLTGDCVELSQTSTRTLHYDITSACIFT